MFVIVFRKMSLCTMNRFLLVVVVVFMPALTFAATVARSDKAIEILSDKFDDFEKRFNKKYKSKEERDQRFMLLLIL